MTIKHCNAWRLKLSICLLFMVTACGGGSGTKLQLDVIAPVITLLGDANVTVTKNTSYTDAGATAMDDIDGGVSVSTNGSVDLKTLGEYTITYTASDSAGNTATKKRMVTVVVDSIAPVITLLGENPAKIYHHSVYTDAGVSVIDEVDGILAATMSGAVDTSIIGTYTLTYSATDLSGNTTNLSRTVNVVADPNRQLVTNIAFLDTSFKSCVVSNDKGYTYADEFLTLDCSFHGIDDLTGLSFFSNLNHLNIFGNQLSDLTLVASLRKLIFLNAGLNRLTDIAFLSELVQLQTLFLANNSIVNISVLKSLTQMEDLDLTENNAIEDISSIASMIGLERLQLNRNRISDITPLSELTQLNHLTLYSNNIRDISALVKLKNLVVLNLSVNGVNDVSALAELPKMVELSLLHNNIETGVALLNKFSVIKQLLLNGNDNIPCAHLDVLRAAYARDVVSMPENCVDVPR